jgi:O-antigen ligase
MLMIFWISISAIVSTDYDVYFSGLFILSVMGAFVFLVFKSFFNNFRFNIPSPVFALMSFYFCFGILGIISTKLNFIFTPTAISEIFKCIVYGIMIITFYQLVDSITTVKRIVKSFIVVAILFALYGYFNAYSVGVQGFIKNGIYAMHAGVESVGNSNEKAALMVYGMVFALAYIMFGSKRKLKYLSGFILGFVALAWIMLNSRSTYLLLATSLILLMLYHKNRWKLIAIAASFAIAVLIAINSIPIFKLILRVQQGLNYRDDLWMAATRMIRENPIIGKGFGYFDTYKFQYMDPTVGRVGIGLTANASPHNLLLSRFVDLGIIGLIIQLLVWILPIASFIKREKYLRSSDNYFLYVGIAAILVGMYGRWIFEVGGNVFGLIWAVILLKIDKLILNEKDSAMSK